MFSSSQSTTPAIVAEMNFGEQPLYFFVQSGAMDNAVSYDQLPEIFVQAEASRKQLAGRIRIDTPDPFINTLGGALAIAADAVWEAPSFLHAAVAWRMRLNG